ncbi:MAG: oxygen-independent coproporphyrinogen III oxidase [Bacteroidota bacterium]
MESLIQKYNVPGPRYTSYPTVPYWDLQSFSEKAYISTLKKAFNHSNSKGRISLYIHLPYCDSLCTFCGCNKRITKNHAVERPYIEAVLKEWQIYLSHFSTTPILSELHLGGGSPSFFSPENLEFLVKGLLRHVKIAENAEFGFEGHPNNTTDEHLNTLFRLGFRRVSFGVQDYDPVVQKAIHRVQPFENVKLVTELSKSIGYESVSHDLIYGLPFQSVETITDTIQKTLSLKPDRLAFYSYAHVPWLPGNGQRGFMDNDLPTAEEKRKFYEVGKKLFEQNGYLEIGMDHFALANDSLFVAAQEGRLNRNFMGYTTSNSQLLVGLGVSSISDTGFSFSQNVKDVDEYINLLNNNILPIQKGHILSNEDLTTRRQITNIMCQFNTSWSDEEFSVDEREQLEEKLKMFEADGLIRLETNYLEVLSKGKPFVRNICMAFDKRMVVDQKRGRIFSQTI